MQHTLHVHPVGVIIQFPGPTNYLWCCTLQGAGDSACRSVQSFRSRHELEGNLRTAAVTSYVCFLPFHTCSTISVYAGYSSAGDVYVFSPSLYVRDGSVNAGYSSAGAVCIELQI